MGRITGTSIELVMDNISSQMSSEQINGRSLVDKYGLFCGYCLNTIKNPQDLRHAKLGLELHHVFPKAGIRRVLSERFPLTWTVPTHFECHRFLFQYVSNVISGVHLLFNRFPTIVDLEYFAKNQHEKGDYWGSTLIKLIEIERTPVADWTKRALLTRHALASASGIKTRSIPAILKNLADLYKDDPGVLLHVANFYVNRGNIKKGFEAYNQAKKVFSNAGRKKQDEELSNLANRRLQLDPTKKNAKEARVITESNWYTKSTSLVLTGSLLFNTYPKMSRTAIEELEHDPASQSWLYVAERLFIIACRELSDQKRTCPFVTESIYEKLIEAQYILCMMGHQGVPHPSLPFLNHKNPSTIMPGDLLIMLPYLSSLNRAKCREIRKRAIEEKILFAKIMTTLWGFSDLLKRK